MPLYVPDVEMKKTASGHPEMLMAIGPEQPLKVACFPQPREAQDRTAFHSRMYSNGSTLVKHQENACCLPPGVPAKVKWGDLTSPEVASV